ncbi:MAG: glutaredoxin family protein [Planctomycetota bacterium]|nr:glutaredoxin family protein [Planctomycetota bacterium]
MPRTPRVVLYTIPGRCPLCDEARTVLEAEKVPFLEVDIRTDRELLRAYRTEIPVVTVDGDEAFRGRIALPDLRARLARRP